MRWVCMYIISSKVRNKGETDFSDTSQLIDMLINNITLKITGKSEM